MISLISTVNLRTYIEEYDNILSVKKCVCKKTEELIGGEAAGDLSEDYKM